MLRQPEIESRANAWKAFMLPLHHWRVDFQKLYNIHNKHNYKYKLTGTVLDETFLIVTQQKRRHPTGLKINWQRWELSVNVSQASLDVYLGTVSS